LSSGESGLWDGANVEETRPLKFEMDFGCADGIFCAFDLKFAKASTSLVADGSKVH